LLVFCLVIGAFGFFGFKTVSAAIYWADPAHQEEPLAGWMTPRYVARSYQLPPALLGEALFFNPEQAPRRVSLAEIAAQNAVTLDDLQARIDAAAIAAQAERDAR
jgi:hypothetical protein